VARGEGADELFSELESEVLRRALGVDIEAVQDESIVDEKIQEAPEEHLPVLSGPRASKAKVTEALINPIHTAHVALVNTENFRSRD